MNFWKNNNCPCDTERSAQFEQVLDKELEYFAKRWGSERKPKRESFDEATNDECDTPFSASIVEEANKARLTGLAFSGGGIRSATFNLGVLQALAKLELLDQFDYLSTVSGGGYIGSWFTAWTHRKDLYLKEEKDKFDSRENNDSDERASNGLESVTRELASSISARGDSKQRAAMQPDPSPIWHLREYSNYLSPRRGLWSTDTWTLGVTYIRNFVLTLSLLLTVLITLVLGTRAIASLYFQAAHVDEYGSYDLAYMITPVLFCLSIFFASLFVSIELFSGRNNKQTSSVISNLAVVATWLAAAVGSIWLWHTITSQHNIGMGIVAFQIIFSSLTGWIIGYYYDHRKVRGPEADNIPEKVVENGFMSWSETWLIIVCPVLSLITLLALLSLLGFWMKGWLPPDLDIERWDPLMWQIVVWGTPLFVLIFSIVAVVFVGVAGGTLRELDREWIGRFFAVLFKWTMLTTFLVILVVYSPCLVKLLGNKIIGPTAAWGTLSVAGAFLARNMMMGKSDLQGWLKKMVLAIAPFVFILGMLILTVWVTDQGVLWIVRQFELITEVNGDPLGSWYVMAYVDVSLLLYMLCVTAVLMFLWSWRIGVNRFSLHSMYADRLIRAYLGASNLERNAHPFTGFCDKDNEVHMPALVQNNNIYSGPYPIINTAINLVSKRRLAWQKRKAASFIFSPLFCGYEFCGENGQKNNEHTGRVGGFVESDRYAGENGRGLSLGKAVTISGAAASPNMGYHSSPALTFLMTTFNLRLGCWLPNTAKRSPALLTKRDPEIGLLYLLYELFGMTDDRRSYVYLSDGGHFENLGIYELVRRRCRIIVASDAEADPNMTFTGLGNAIEKCRTDLGVPIKIDVSQIKPDTTTGRSLWHCAVGCIRYSEADPGQPDGTLVYIKASLTGDEPQDVATYASANDCFPHETTADQWFDETQFESYRMLGEHTIQITLTNAVNFARRSVKPGKSKNKHFIERVILEARKQWYSESGSHSDEPADHDALLGSIMDTLRTDKHLAFLDEQLYPNLRKVADAYPDPDPDKIVEHSMPRNYKDFRAGFYFCKRLLQFMQQVYYDQQLDLEYAAPRNRGWMNLFRRWSWSRMLRFTWTMTAGTYGARFQSFCEHHLSLESGEPEICEKPLEIHATLPSGSDQYQLVLIPPLKKDVNKKFKWVDVADEPFGLHYYETRLIREFINAYAHHEDLEDCSKPYEFQVFPIKVATDDPIAKQVDKDMKLNAGFLITGPLKKSDNAPSTKAILYFRIRPSMRNMDLARKAFQECRRHNILKDYTISLDKELPVCEMPKAAWQRRAYGDVHSMNRENLDHCRWFSQLQDDVEEEKPEDHE